MLWGLERVRLEREWHDIAGAAAPAPVSWDDPVAAALAIELELIRESIGTPSQLEVAPGRIRTPGQTTGTPSRPASRPGPGPELVSGCSGRLLCAVPAVRLVAEALRRLAHVGEELLVRVGQSDVQVTVAVAPGTERPDLGELAQLAVAAGALVELTMADETVQLTVDMVQDEGARAVE